MTEENERHTWDPNAMIRNAKSLQSIARYLLSAPFPQDAQSLPPDEFLYTGRFFASPIMLALATEIALKAWQCRERNEPPHRTHDLVALFDALSEDARRILEASCPNDVVPRGLDVSPEKVRYRASRADASPDLPTLPNRLPQNPS